MNTTEIFNDTKYYTEHILYSSSRSTSTKGIRREIDVKLLSSDYRYTM